MNNINWVGVQQVATFLIFVAMGFGVGVLLAEEWIKDKIKSIGSSYYRMDMAMHFYGKDWYRAMKECNESHLGDECYLCGKSGEVKDEN